MRAAPQLAWLWLVASCGGRGTPGAATTVPQNRGGSIEAPIKLRLPDEPCLRRGAERYPEDREGFLAAGGCRLDGELYGTGRWCVADLRALGGEGHEFSGCYRQAGTTFTLEFARLHKDEVQILFELYGKGCCVMGGWDEVPGAVKDFVLTTAKCTTVRLDCGF